MITNFALHNMVVEKAGINSDVKRLSEELFNLLKDEQDTIKIYNGKLFKTNILHINRIYVHIFKQDDINRYEASFNVSKSKITKKGFNINLKISQNNINLKTIHHELNHALQFYMTGKDKAIERSAEMTYHELSSEFINNPAITNFIKLYYYSQPHEIDSYITEAYYEIKDKILDDLENEELQYINIEQYNNKFIFFKKFNIAYENALILNRFNCSDFKKLNSSNLITFFQTLDNKRSELEIIEKRNNLKQFIISVKKIAKIIFKNEYYIKDNNKAITIENLDKILKYYDNRFKQASHKYIEKIDKLYSIIYDDLLQENIIIPHDN